MIFKNDIVLIRILYLRLFALMYLFAFLSVFYQIHTLWGFSGILPQQWFLKRVEPQILSKLDEDQKEGPYILMDKYFMAPTLLWFTSLWNEYFVQYLPGDFQNFKPVDTMQYVFSLWGIFLSLFLFVGKPRILMNSFSYLILWVLYLSHYCGGDKFMSFQWDILLLEGGFITIFFAPTWHTDIYEVTPSIHLVREILRWLAFRLMFASGVVKLLSGCKAWWSLTALNYHYETQPIPHYLSWYAHQMPDIHKKYSVVFTFVIEIFLPFLFYSPFRLHRIVSSMANIILMLLIMLTGNYNFFNMLTMTLLMVVLDDQFVYKYIPNWVFKAFGIRIPLEYIFEQQEEKVRPWSLFGFLRSTISLASLSAFFYFMYLLFPPSLVSKGKMNFNIDDVRSALKDQNYLFAFFLYLAVFVITILIMESFRWVARNRDSIFNTFSGAISFTFMIIFSYILFLASAHIFFKGLSIDPKAVPFFNHQTGLKAYQYSANFHITSSYGLFRSMTGIEGRPEIVLLGSVDFKEWKEYEFHYKPGNLSKIAGSVMPHQPRFDWQLWFSALGQLDREYYLIHFLYKLLNNDTIAKSLISYDPFNGEPPKYVKMDLYNYWLTDYKQQKVTFGVKNLINKLPVMNYLHRDIQKYFKNDKLSEKLVPDNWWRRTRKSEYSQTLSKENLEDFVVNNKLTFYNSNPQSEIHPLGKVPAVSLCAALIIIVFCMNIARKKLQVIALYKNTMEEYKKAMSELQQYVDATRATE